jgi:hypothetical protein
VFRLVKYLPVIIPLLKKASRDPRVQRAIVSAQKRLRGSGR